ncbi:MAG TPA: 4Fe-4S binding protein [Gammaproteobacteria bacterium]|nr:4Fe-4S binding protein [Gammaproteobacteria bacterium]
MNKLMVKVQRHLNKVRWGVLSLVFSMLILLPFLHLYQTYEAAHAYDLLSPSEKTISDTMEWISKPFVNDPEVDLNNLKGTTWSGTLFGLKLSDPLAVVGQISAGKTVYLPFLLTALIPIILTLIFGRFFCGWICPATFIYELNDNLATWLRKAGIPVGKRKLDFRLKYLVLVMGIIISAATGMIAFASVYPPALIGREIYYAIALSGFGSGMIFFLMTLLFDLMVTRRGFCRYVCPGGALYSLLGHFRLFRIQRDVTQCNDCAKCNVVCQFGLDPLRDDFTQECNNCTACIAVCPTDALSFKVTIKDAPNQGAGHLGHEYKRLHDNKDQ